MSIVTINAASVNSMKAMSALSSFVAKAVGSDSVIVFFVLGLSLTLNVYLGIKLRSDGSVPVVSIGERLPALLLRDLEGAEASLSYGSGEPGRTVLYVVSPDCSWCERNRENIKTVFEAKRSDYRFVGLSLSDTRLREYWAGTQLAFPVLTGLTRPAVSAYKLSATPETIVVEKGAVSAVWVGAYIGSVAAEVERYFGVKLPGLVEGQRKAEFVDR